MVRCFRPEFFYRDGKRITIDRGHLTFIMRNYWELVLVYSGKRVLQGLKVASEYSCKRTAFRKGTSLLHMFEVSKYFLDSPYLDGRAWGSRVFQTYVGISTDYFDVVFPLDWRKAVSKELVSLRETDLSYNLLNEIIRQNVVDGSFDYMSIGRVMMICSVSRISVPLYKHIITKIDWFIKDDHVLKTLLDTYFYFGVKHSHFGWALQNVLHDHRLVSPHSLVYFLDLLFWIKEFNGEEPFLASKSVFVGFRHLNSFATLELTIPAPNRPSPPGEDAIVFIANTAVEIFANKSDTISWFEKSKFPQSYLTLLALKLVMILSLSSLKNPSIRALDDLLLAKK